MESPSRAGCQQNRPASIAAAIAQAAPTRVVALATPSALAVSLALTLAGCLVGCNSQPTAQSSASRITFENALGADYETALAAAVERADDAKLLAVSSETFSQAHFPSSWMFLFYSWKRASAYTVHMTDGQATVTDNPGFSLTQEDFGAIADPAGVDWDCERAYNQAIEQLDDQGEYLTCRAYLMTYVPEDDDPEADALKWFFVFNDEQDLRSIYLDPNADLAPATTLSVDGSTGKVERGF